MTTRAPDEPLLEFGIALAGVIGAVEDGQPLVSTAAYETATRHFRRLEMHMAWLADVYDPRLELVLAARESTSGSA